MEGLSRPCLGFIAEDFLRSVYAFKVGRVVERGQPGGVLNDSEDVIIQQYRLRHLHAVYHAVAYGLYLIVEAAGQIMTEKIQHDVQRIGVVLHRLLRSFRDDVNGDGQRVKLVSVKFGTFPGVLTFGKHVGES